MATRLNVMTLIDLGRLTEDEAQEFSNLFAGATWSGVSAV